MPQLISWRGVQDREAQEELWRTQRICVMWANTYKLTGENGLRQRRRERESDSSCVYLQRKYRFSSSFTLLACSCFKHDTGSVSMEEICGALNIQISSRLRSLNPSSAWISDAKLKQILILKPTFTALVSQFSWALLSLCVCWIHIHLLFLMSRRDTLSDVKTQRSQAFRFVCFHSFFLLPWKGSFCFLLANVCHLSTKRSTPVFESVRYLKSALVFYGLARFCVLKQKSIGNVRGGACLSICRHSYYLVLRLISK